jgi:hypothetical protein
MFLPLKVPMLRVFSGLPFESNSLGTVQYATMTRVRERIGSPHVTRGRSDILQPPNLISTVLPLCYDPSPRPVCAVDTWTRQFTCELA